MLNLRGIKPHQRVRAVLVVISALYVLMPSTVHAQYQRFLKTVLSTSSTLYNNPALSSLEVDVIQGTIFNDIDLDGIQDVEDTGVSQIPIELYDDNGLVTTQISDASGDFSFSGLIQNQVYQVSLGTLPVGWSETFISPDHLGDIRNVTTIQDPVLIGVYDAQGHCQLNPYIITPCYVEGPHNGTIASEPAVVKLLADADGHHFTGANATGEYEASSIVNYGQIGTVYGVAWQSAYRSYYAASFHKRYTDFGPEGPDAIYQYGMDGNLMGAINFDLLLGQSSSTGGDVHDLIADANGTIYDLGINDISFDAPGKRAFGDIEISDDGNTLYVVNLWDRKIYALDISTGNPANAVVLNVWDAPDETGTSDVRPFGLAYHDNKLWVGSVNEVALSGYVHSLNVSTGATTLELTIPLNYNRQAFYGDANNANAPGEWNLWGANSTLNYYSPSAEIAYPQAMITDIEFAQNGAMIIGIRDRFGDQVSAGKRFRPSDANLTWGIAQGDILRACFIGGNYVLESGATGACSSGSEGLNNSGPGGVEFYHWDIYEFETNSWNPDANNGAFHWETAQGGLLQLDSADFVITTALDPFHDFSGGIIKFNNTTGRRVGAGSGAVPYANLEGGYTIYETGDFQGGLPAANGYAGKANGLGDLESACVQDIMIGNLVWEDVDRDGVQDPNENGISNIQISLYKDDVLQGVATTDVNGQYFFGGPQALNMTGGILLSPNTNYEIRVTLPIATNITQLTMTDVSSNGQDQRDNDATLISTNNVAPTEATIAFFTGASGVNNYSFDIGFTSCNTLMSNFQNISCSGDGYATIINGTTYDESNPSGNETIVTANGCDSIVTVELIFSATHDTTISQTGIVGDGFEIIVGNDIYNETNPQGSTLLSKSNGCDSVVNVDLVFISPPNNVESCQVLIQDDFESSYGNWNDGGNDCTRLSNASFASSGNISVRLRDNSNTSFMTSDDLSAATVDSLKVSFHFYPSSFETNEDFWLQISTDGGGAYTTVETWVVGVDFTNDIAQNVTVSVPGPFTNNTRVRIRCDATSNGDRIYIDDVVVEACETAVAVNCPVVSLLDISFCAGEIVQLDANPSGGVAPYIGHQWIDLGSGSSTGYILNQTNNPILNLDLTAAIGGDIDLSYRVIGQDGCATTDTINVIVLSDPLCEIVSLVDTLCKGLNVALDLVDEYIVSPMAGFVPAGDTVGVTVQHEIIGIVDPNATKVTITLPTWDDHFDTILLNGNMILPEIFEPASYNATGMNCLRPWLANVNGLPRSIVTIENGSVRYYSSLTINDTIMTEVFPTAWVTTPQDFIEGNNTLQFGIQNTAGPVSGSWSIVAEANIGYKYLWSTGDTSQSLIVNPDTTTTYSVTVTGAEGCQSVCEKTIQVTETDVQVVDVQLCAGDTALISGVVTTTSNVQSYQWDIIGANNGLILGSPTSDTLIIDASAASSGVVMIGHAVTSVESCVSIDTFLITITEPSFESIDYNLCQGDTLEVNGLIISTSGVYTSTFPVLACDSVIQYNVTVQAQYNENVTYVGCSGDGYEISVNGVLYNETNPAGQENMTTSYGCDSIVNVNLVFHPSYNEQRTYQGCSDDAYSLVVNGTTYDVNNPTGVEMMQTIQECDSTIAINLQFDDAVIVEGGLIPEAICSNADVNLSVIGASISGGTSLGTWTSVGGGVFDGGGVFGVAQSYTSSNTEIDAGVIILTLTSADPPGICEPKADAVMILINDLRCSQFPWAGN